MSPTETRRNSDRAARPRLAAVVLAAGASSRMGGPNKLLLPLGNGPVLPRSGWPGEPWTVLDGVLEAAAAGLFAEVVVVTGRDAESVARLSGRHAGRVPLRTVYNAAWAGGMGGSIAAGVAAADARADGYAVFVGDAPFVRLATLARLRDAFAALPGLPAQDAAVVAPRFEGRRGHPVLFSAALRAELLALDGDAGARRVVERHAGSLRCVDTDDAGVVLDLDTPDAYRDACACPLGVSPCSVLPSADDRSVAR